MVKVVTYVSMDYPQITPFNSEDYYHDKCDIVDLDNQWQIENCRLCDLSYLKQENDWVTTKLAEWINDIANKYDIDRIRIDTII